MCVKKSIVLSQIVWLSVIMEVIVNINCSLVVDNWGSWELPETTCEWETWLACGGIELKRVGLEGTTGIGILANNSSSSSFILRRSLVSGSNAELRSLTSWFSCDTVSSGELEIGANEIEEFWGQMDNNGDLGSSQLLSICSTNSPVWLDWAAGTWPTLLAMVPLMCRFISSLVCLE